MIAVTEKLLETSNKIHLEITKNDTVKVEIPFSKKTIFKLAPEGYKNLKQIFPNLEYKPRSIKNEAQVNALIPDFKFPTTTTHEMAHQLGYAAENEANFIGCLAAINHDNIYFKYAGYTFALRFCINEIYRRDSCLYEDMIADINKGILKNYKETRDFWDAHQNPTEPLFKLFYGSFLKANKQSKGMESYSYVVALLTNYFENKTL